MTRFMRTVTKLVMFGLAWSLITTILIPMSSTINASAAGRELLVNGDFERVESGSFPGWNAINTQTIFEPASTVVYEGEHSVKVTDTDSIGKGLRSAFQAAIPHEKYQASVFSYNESGRSQLYLEFWDSSRTRISTAIQTQSTLNAWQQIEVQAEAPAEAAFVTIVLYLDGPNVGAAYFDLASLMIVESEEEPQEFLVNGGFEEFSSGSFSGWNVLNSGTIFEQVSSTVYEGEYSVKITDTDSLGKGLRSQFYPVNPNQAYQASVYSYNESGRSQLYLEFWDSSHTRIQTTIQTNSSLGLWQQIEIKAMAPETAAYATVLVYLDGPNTGISYFDNASLRIAPEEEVMEFPLLINEHPRLYFTQDDIPSIQAKAADDINNPLGMTGKQIWDVVEAQARSYLAETSFTVTYYGGHLVTYPVPPAMPEPLANPPGYTSGRYPYWTMLSTSIQNRIEALSWAYVVTEEEPFADKAKQYALALAAWPAWSDPTYTCAGITCLDTAHLTIAVSTAYDILYDKFTPAERALLEQAIEQKGLIPLWTDTAAEMDHNLQALRASALGTGGSVLLGKSPNANKYLTRAVQYYTWYFDKRMESGEQEGLGYTSYSVDNIMRGVDHIYRTTGVEEVINHPFLNDFVIRWITYFLAPGGAGLANFSDSEAANYYPITMSILNSQLSNGHAGWYLKETKAAEASLNGFIYMDPFAVIEKPDQPISTVLEEIGWAALRTGWEREDQLLAFISNNSQMGHNQYDQNSFQIATNGSWIAFDPGTRDYVPGPVRDFTERLGHSTIQVDGQGQSRTGGGSLTRGMLSETYDYVTGSAADAYGSPNLTKFDRHIVFIKPDYYVIFDDLEADTPRQFDWILYNGSVIDYKINGAQAQEGVTVPGDHLYVNNGKAELSVKFVQDHALPLTIAKYPGAERFGYYVRAESSEPAAAQQFLTVLKSGKSQETGIYEEYDLLPPVTSTGKEYKVLSSAGKTFIFYRGEEAGDSITYRVTVPEDGMYTVSSSFIQSPLYGKFQVYVNDQPLGAPFDGYHPFVQAAEPYIHGQLNLTAGDHLIRYEIVGQNPQSGGFLMGLDSLRLVREGSESGSNTDLDAERISGINALGARIYSPTGINSFKEDYVLFKTGQGMFAVEGIEGNPDQAVVQFDDSGGLAGYKMTRGTTLSYDQQILLQGSSTAFQASVDKLPATGEWKAVIELASPQSVALHVESATEVAVNGDIIAPEDYDYDPQTGLLTLNLQAGTHNIVISGAMHKPS
ncbi:heparinase II/III domain-containing protein [Paenibacillus senegalensis]|uniref:heparinase II/III domain-containing protein n=1 Tax=Paenibacillus senegalensis TaxID=1465766 RepID=UPI0012FA1AEB|nr:heparinase II/III family protein [Paenibacillus senegalensis]